MIMKRLIMIISVFLIFQAGSGSKASDEIDFGTIENSTYKNNYFGFSIKIPTGWSVQDEEMRQKIMDTGRKMVAGDDKNLNAAIKASEMQTLNLLTVFKYEVGSPVEFNPSIACLAEKIHHMPGIKRGKDYHFHTRRILENNQNITVSFPKEIYTKEVDGINFDIMTLEMPFGSKTVKQKQYATVMKGYALLIIVSFLSSEEEAELEKVLESIRFQN